MRDEPELLVPVSEVRHAPRHRPRRFAVVLARLWIVLALLATWLVLEAGFSFRAGLLTIAGFALVWVLIGWIFAPALPSDGEQR